MITEMFSTLFSVLVLCLCLCFMFLFFSFYSVKKAIHDRMTENETYVEHRNA